MTPAPQDESRAMSDDIPNEPAFGPYDATDNPPPLDFERWTEVSAELIERTPDEMDDILDRRELDPRLWQAVTVFWLGELNQQVCRQNFRLASRFGQRCMEELARRPQPSKPEQLAADVDATAFMAALPDDTALPFDSPLAVDPEPPCPAPLSEMHPQAGQTQEVAALDDGTLPFDD